ncbi:MAG: hypothetical protein ACPIOQ_64380, partial [Promethearchaeia archaeon]
SSLISCENVVECRARELVSTSARMVPYWRQVLHRYQIMSHIPLRAFSRSRSARSSEVVPAPAAAAKPC